MADQVNDVNVDKIKELDGMIRATPALGKMTMKATSTWERGTKSLVTVGRVEAQGQDLFPRTRKWVVMTDDPEVLGGVDAAPSPAEMLLAALAGCVTSGIATNAALFGVPVDSLEIAMEADLDARGVMGIDRSVPNGFTDIRYTVTVQSPAAEDQVRRCKETIDRKSPVRSTLANPVRITSEFVYKPR